MKSFDIKARLVLLVIGGTLLLSMSATGKPLNVYLDPDKDGIYDKVASYDISFADALRGFSNAGGSPALGYEGEALLNFQRVQGAEFFEPQSWDGFLLYLQASYPARDVSRLPMCDDHVWVTDFEWYDDVKCEGLPCDPDSCTGYFVKWSAQANFKCIPDPPCPPEIPICKEIANKINIVAFNTIGGTACGCEGPNCVKGTGIPNGTGIVFDNDACECFPTYPSRIPVLVTALDAQVDSIDLPLPGDPNTGPITIVLNPDMNPHYLSGHVDCDYDEGTLSWPTLIDFPLLTEYELDPISAELVGPLIIAESDFLICFDMGYVDHPMFGRVLLSNNNKNYKNEPVQTLCDNPGQTITGYFDDITPEDFSTYEQPWLRGAMDVSVGLLQTINPGMPSVSSGLLDTLYQMYVDEPSKEIILYFFDSNEYRSSDLSGTDALTSKLTVPTLSEWGLIIFSLLVLSLVTIVVTRRRMAMAGAGTGADLATSIKGPLLFPTIFLKALAATLSLAVVILITAMIISGSVPLRDIVGTILSAGIVAYIVHLWIYRSREL